MFYVIQSLCPRTDIDMGRHGFSIKLYPAFKEAVAVSEIDQAGVHRALDNMGRDWLDACGYNGIFDIDNCGFHADPSLPPGPKARPMYEPNRDMRVSWGEWGPEHISVPGNACGLDIDVRGFGSPDGGAILYPHNVDSWSQKQLLLITFCWFAETIALNYECKQRGIS